MQGYSPTSILPPAPSTIFLLDNMTGFYLLLFVLEGVLLRYVRPRDVEVWRCVQAGGVLVDAFMVLGWVRMVSAEGPLAGGKLWDVGAWRGDDWKNGVGNVGMGLVRLGCAMGVGMGTAAGTGRKGRVS